MKATLTAINPPHTTNIFSGIKTVEWRTFAMPKGLHYVYETKKKGGVGLVIGKMLIMRSFCYNQVNDIPEYLIEAGCVSRGFLREYAKGKRLYANVVSEAQLLPDPKPYTDFKKYIEPPSPRERKRSRPYYFVYYGKTLRKINKKDLKAPPQSSVYIEVIDK